MQRHRQTALQETDPQQDKILRTLVVRKIFPTRQGGKYTGKQVNMVDRRGVLDETVFTYRITKDKKVFISYEGNHVTTLSGKKSEKFISDIAGLDGKDLQLVMAKVTGNFKRGNERVGKR